MNFFFVKQSRGMEINEMRGKENLTILGLPPKKCYV